MNPKTISTTYLLTPFKLAVAQRVLATTPGIEAIEEALDQAVFRQELIDGTAAMLGVELASPDPNEIGVDRSGINAAGQCGT